MKTFFLRSPVFGRKNRLNSRFRPENPFKAPCAFDKFLVPLCLSRIHINKLLVPPKIYFCPPPIMLSWRRACYELPACKQENCNVIISYFPHSPFLQSVESCCAANFYATFQTHYFFIKIALKLSYFCKKMQNFLALGAPPPDLRASGGWGLCPHAPSLRQQGALPTDPH